MKVNQLQLSLRVKMKRISIYREKSKPRPTARLQRMVRPAGIDGWFLASATKFQHIEEASC